MKMRSFFFSSRFLVYSSLAMLLLAAGGVHLLDRAMNGERFRAVLEKNLSESLQRKLTIENVRWRWFPLPRLIGDNVQFFEIDGTRLAKARKVVAAIKLEPLFRRKIDIGSLTFVKPEFVFQRSKNGRINVVSLINDIKGHNEQQNLKPEPGSSVEFFLRQVRIKNASIEIIDKKIKDGPLATRFNVDGVFELGYGSEPTRFEADGTATLEAKSSRFSVFGSFGDEINVRLLSSAAPVRAIADYEPFLKNIGGDTSVNASVTASGSKTDWRVQATATNLRFQGRPDLPIFSADFDVRSDSDSRVQLMLTSTGTAAQADLRLHDLDSKNISANVTSEWSDVKQVVSWAHSLASMADKAEADAPAQETTDQPLPWSGSVHLEAKNVQIEKEVLAVARLNAALSKNGELTVNNFDISGLGGTMKGTASVMDGIFHVDWQAADIDSARLEDVLEMKPLSTGKLTSQGSIAGSTTAFKSPALNGEFEVSLNKGIVFGMPGLLKTLTSFNLKSLIRKVEGRAKVEGLPFETVKARFIIENGVIRTQGAAMLQNDTLQLAMMGKADLVNGTVDGDMVFYFLTVLDEAINSIPGIRTVLLGGKKSLIPTWVKVSGPIDDPQITALPAKTLTDTAWSTIRNTFNFPRRVLRAFIRQKDSATTPTNSAQ